MSETLQLTFVRPNGVAVPAYAQKHCTRCDRMRAVTEFQRNKSKEDGRQKWCRECNNEYQKIWGQRKRQKQHADTHAPVTSPEPQVIKTKPLIIQRTCVYCAKQTPTTDFHPRFKNYHKLCWLLYRKAIYAKKAERAQEAPVTDMSWPRRFYGILRGFFGRT